MKNKLFALVGPHASGKTAIVRELIKAGIHYIPLYTTRSPEAYANNPVGAATMYRFVDKNDFVKQDFLVKITYKGEYYGMMKNEILSALQSHPCSVVISDAQGIKQLSKLLKDSFESIYIMTDYVSLIERMLKLGHTNEEIKHHLEYAENNGEFESWKFATHVVKNVSTEEKAMNQILSIMGLTEMLPVEKIKALTSRRVTE